MVTRENGMIVMTEFASFASRVASPIGATLDANPFGVIEIIGDVAPVGTKHTVLVRKLPGTRLRNRETVNRPDAVKDVRLRAWRPIRPIHSAVIQPNDLIRQAG